MLMNLKSITKTLGTKKLYRGLDLVIQDNEKVGLIGRNGTGKTTLLGIMAGTDPEFKGEVQRRRGLVTAATIQEHHEVEDELVIDYILANLPDYARLKEIIDTYPATMGDDMDLIEVYSEALERYTQHNYFTVTDRIHETLREFQLPEEAFMRPVGSLSGGQKRFVELVKVIMSGADLALIDEPTNHMDVDAKAAFIEWMSAESRAMVIVTHDRDVLAKVDRIVEVKDQNTFSYPGNYEQYLKQNGTSTMSAVEQYEYGLRSLENVRKQVIAARTKKNMAGGKSAVRFRILEDRLQREYNALSAGLEKPSFWIDAEQLGGMQSKLVDKYDRYKAKNIRIQAKTIDQGTRPLVSVDGLALGYETQLFEPVDLRLRQGERLQLEGRNGTGKTTLIKALLATARKQKLPTKVFAGSVELDAQLIIGVYEQEIAGKYLDVALGEAVMEVYRDHNVSINDEKMRRVLSDYLFEPQQDAKLPINQLSGGQKARFQLISMLCTAPNLLILDEPTNHLDLPSIEELEKTLLGYTGAILYVSHDSYFAHNVGGEVVPLIPAN